MAGADETVNKDQVDFPENTQHINCFFQYKKNNITCHTKTARQ
jgi:hypothetical protein